MKLKKINFWYHNKSTSDIVLDELQCSINHGAVVDICQLNPNISYDQILHSENYGVLFDLKNKGLLVKIDKPLSKNKISETPRYKVSTQVRKTKAFSMVDMAANHSDIIPELEAEFPVGSAPLSQKEVWDEERKKMLQKIESSEIGDEGEVFDDNIFEKE